MQIKFKLGGCLLLLVLISSLINPSVVLAADLPDPEASGINVTTLYTGVTNKVIAVIGNSSTTACDSFTVSLEVDGEELAASTGNYLSGCEDTWYYPLSVSFDWIPEEAGDYTLSVIVDPDSTVAETDETNNEFTLSVSVIDLADITVSVRVEGLDATIWNGEVTFSSSEITDKQGDAWTVDHPTVLGALEGAADEGDFNYVVSSSYGTLAFIESIAGEDNSGSDGWLYTVNWTGADCAAIDYTLADGDQVLWYYGGWAAQTLSLSVDKTSLDSSDTFTVTVEACDGDIHTPVENATVIAGSHLYTTDANGQVTAISLSPGGYSLYAEKDTCETYIRSNTCEVLVYVTLEIRSGWNFISLPRRLDANASDIASLFSGIDTGGHSIFGYDPETGWQALEAGDTVSPLDGIWLYSTGDVVLYPVFDTNPLNAPLTKKLSAGWNAIGFTDFTAASANSTLTSVEDSWAYLIGFDAASQTYENSIVNNAAGSDSHSENRVMETWKGYWLYMTGDGELAALSN